MSINFNNSENNKYDLAPNLGPNLRRIYATQAFISPLS